MDYDQYNFASKLDFQLNYVEINTQDDNKSKKLQHYCVVTSLINTLNFTIIYMESFGKRQTDSAERKAKSLVS